MATLNEELRDASIRHAIGLRRVGTRLSKRIVALIRRSELRVAAELAQRLESADPGSWTIRRLDRLLAELRQIGAQAAEEAEALLRQELRELADYELDWQATAFAQSSPIEFEIVRPAMATVEAAVLSQPFQGKLLKEWFAELEEASARRVRETVRMGVIEGRTTAQIVSEIRGFLDISSRHAEAMVRTAVNHTTTAARDRLFEANADIIKGVMWVSTLDGRTTAICRARDGQVYPVDSGPRPPAHWSCRSTCAPITKSWAELGFNDIPDTKSIGSRPFVADSRRVADIPKSERAALIGQVPGDMTYNDWLRTQPRGFVEETLGKTKARLYLDGKLSLDRFVDRAGSELTLDDLRRRESTAFRRAGLV